MRHGLLVLMLSALAALVRFTQRELDGHRAIRFVDVRPVFLPRGRALEAMALGHRGLLADWLWIKTVLYYGRRVQDEDNPYYRYAVAKGSLGRELQAVRRPKPDSAAASPMIALRQNLAHLLMRFDSRGLVDYIYPMLEAVTTADPHFIFPYLFGGVYVLMDTGEIDRAVALLEKGRATNPGIWQFPFYLGWVHWMYRGDLATTQRHLLEAVVQPKCPDYVGDLLRGVAGDLRQTGMARMYLERLRESSDNADLRRRIERVLEALSHADKASPQKGKGR